VNLIRPLLLEIIYCFSIILSLFTEELDEDLEWGKLSEIIDSLLDADLRSLIEAHEEKISISLLRELLKHY